MEHLDILNILGWNYGGKIKYRYGTPIYIEYSRLELRKKD